MKTPSSRPSMTFAWEQAAPRVTVPEPEQCEIQNVSRTNDQEWAIIPLITAPSKKNEEE